MFMQSLFITSALVAAPAAQTPPATTPDTTRPAASHPAGQADKAPGHADKAHGDLPAADATFVKKAADGGMAEVAMAKLAQEKAESAEVKAYAAKLEKDHSQANDELKQVASQKGVTLPDAPSKMHQATHDKLAKLSGAAFDRAYVAAMLEDHRKDVKEFARVASGSGDAAVKAFAAKTLPTLKEHLAQVQDLARTTGAKKPTS